MGTNYYWVEDAPPACPACGHGAPPVRRHIGKSSAGWVFALHVYPEEGINTLADWMDHLGSRGHGAVKDEYGEGLTVTEMHRIITVRTWIPRSVQNYEANHAEPGPNGLMRAKVDGVYCIGHGEGTWDYHVGNFS